MAGILGVSDSICIAPFGLAILVCLATALVTVSIHATRALRADPVQGVRDE